MQAPPADKSAPSAPEADEVPVWLYRSEGFAEDLDDDDEVEPAVRNAPGRK